jgi:hypothetical protein
MKRQILNAIIRVSFLVLIAFISANAQTPAEIAFNVPFDFYVKNQKLPAGTYLIKSLDPYSDQATLVIRQKEGKAALIIRGLPLEVSTEEFEALPSLTFSCYGSSYFLSEIRNPARKFGAQLSKSRTEKNLAGQFGKEKTETVALNSVKRP